MKGKKFTWEALNTEEERTNKEAERQRNEGWNNGLELGKMRTSFIGIEKSRKRRFKGSRDTFG